MVECLVWDQDAAGSSPVASTNFVDFEKNIDRHKIDWYTKKHTKNAGVAQLGRATDL